MAGKAFAYHFAHYYALTTLPTDTCRRIMEISRIIMKFDVILSDDYLVAKLKRFAE